MTSYKQTTIILSFLKSPQKGINQMTDYDVEEINDEISTWNAMTDEEKKRFKDSIENSEMPIRYLFIDFSGETPGIGFCSKRYLVEVLNMIEDNGELRFKKPAEMTSDERINDVINRVSLALYQQGYGYISPDNFTFYLNPPASEILKSQVEEYRLDIEDVLKYLKSRAEEHANMKLEPTSSSLDSPIELVISRALGCKI
jgi:hypothetical protein